MAALVLIGGALTRFRRAGTPAEPWQASAAIVTHGVYGYTRNPMYVAMTLFYGAIALAADSLITLLVLFPLLVVVHYGVVLLVMYGAMAHPGHASGGARRRPRPRSI